MQTSKQQDFTEWINSHRLKTDDAIRTIQSSKKQCVSEYDERLRRLKAFANTLFIKARDPQQAELFEPKKILTPDLNDLLSSPTKGLA